MVLGRALRGDAGSLMHAAFRYIRLQRRIGGPGENWLSFFIFVGNKGQIGFVSSFGFWVRRGLPWAGAHGNAARAIFAISCCMA